MSAQAFTFLAALLLLALAAGLAFRPRVRVRRELPRYATAREPLSYSVTIENVSHRPLRGAALGEMYRDPRPSFADWAAAREPGEERRNWFDRRAGYFRWRWLIERRIPLPEQHAPLPDIAPGERRSVRLALTPRRRGRIEFEGMTLSRPDPLGLVKALARVPAEAGLVALPRRYRLPDLPLPSARRFQRGGVPLASSVSDSEEFVSLREYRPGDPLQKVHWKSFARTGRPIVKEYQDEFFERHALVLDTSSAAGEDAAFEEAVSIAASFVYAVDTRECLLDLLFVGGEVRSYTAGRGQIQAEHMLEVLAGVAPSAPEAFDALADVLLSRRGSLSSCILVLLAWDERRRALVDGLARVGLEVRTLLVCARERAPAQAPPGALVLHPGEIESGLARLR